MVLEIHTSHTALCCDGVAISWAGQWPGEIDRAVEFITKYDLINYFAFFKGACPGLRTTRIR